jgi:capsular polysaccharide biosynthesis protein
VTTSGQPARAVGTSTAESPAMAESPSMAVDVLAHLRTIRRELVAALAVAVIAGLAVYAYLDRQTPLYEARLAAYVETAAEPGSPADIQTRTTWTAQAVELARNVDVLEEIVTASGEDWTADQAADRVTVAEDPATGVTAVRVLGGSPEEAARVAEQVVSTLDERLTQLREEAVTDQLADLQEDAAAAQRQIARLAEADPRRPGLQRDLDNVLDQIADAREERPGASLTAIGNASAPGEVAAPRPVRTAVTMSLVVLLATAEGLALSRRMLRARRARRDKRRQVSHVAPIPTREVDVPHSGPRRGATTHTSPDRPYDR